MVSLRCIIALFYELLMEVSNPGKVKERKLHTHPLTHSVVDTHPPTHPGALPSFFLQVHYPVPESLASLAWGQAGRLLSAIFLGMFRWCWLFLFQFDLYHFTISLEEAGIVEGVSWMNYFLVIFIALPLALLLTVKVTQDLPLYISPPCFSR